MAAGKSGGAGKGKRTGPASARAGGREVKAKSPEKPVGQDLLLRCALIPPQMRLQGNLAATQAEFEAILALAQPIGAAGARVLGGGSGKTFKPEAMTNLWFVRAVQEFARAAGAVHDEAHATHAEFAKTALLPMCKGIVQEFISEQGIGGVRMDDGGMLAETDKAGTLPPLRLNALWYGALEGTGAAFRAISWAAGKGTGGGGAPGGRDAVGDHFERLAGRFRRAFAKAYWCDKHDRICPPASGGNAARHGGEAARADAATGSPDHGGVPDAEQVLLTMLPASPLPVTKQKQIRHQIQAKAMGSLGVIIEHPVLGLVESPLHLAWMAQGAMATAESTAERDQALALARKLTALWQQAKTTGVHAFYQHGQPVGEVDPLTTAEVLATLHQAGQGNRIIESSGR